MLGNCATGRARMVMAPTITMTMEITMATMGRLMKNLDMGLVPLRPFGKRFGGYLHTRAHLLDALGNNALAWFQSFRNNPLVADLAAHLDGTDADFVLGVHDCHLVAAL